jgi:ribosome-binding protein aMBF1 (putative translation factor)
MAQAHSGAVARHDTTLPQSQLERDICHHRAQLADKYAEYIKSLDDTDKEAWALIVSTARDAGLKKEDLCRELSCAWSTILRWQTGDTAPGPFARRTIKQKLVEMILEVERAEEHKAAAAA